MASMDDACSTCGSPVRVAVGERVVQQKIVWFRSYRCPACGNRIEEDDHGLPPEEIRKAILEQEGEWSLVVEASGDPAVLKVLRHSLQLSMADVAKLRKRMPNQVFQGTRAEVERLASLFDNAGVRSQVVRLER